MRIFKDGKGREWTLNLTLGDAIRIKSSLGVDILQPESAGDNNQTLADRLLADGLLLAQIIACMLQPQFEKLGMTREDMLESFDAETIKESTKAFFEECIDFFHRSGRTDREKLIQKILLVLNEGIRIVDEKLSSIDMQKQIQHMQKVADEKFGKLFGGSEELSASILEG